jgi:hypothetical protein
MQDRMLVYLLFIPVSIIILLLMTMVLLNLANEEPANPIAKIPQVIFDHAGGETIVTVIAVGKQRYDEIHLNYTVSNETHNSSSINRYTADVNITATFFELNVTVIIGNDHYMLNCTVEVETLQSGNVYLWIQEEDDSDATRHRIPYTLLAEWREIE